MDRPTEKLHNCVFCRGVIVEGLEDKDLGLVSEGVKTLLRKIAVHKDFHCSNCGLVYAFLPPVIAER